MLGVEGTNFGQDLELDDVDIDLDDDPTPDEDDKKLDDNMMENFDLFS